MDTRHTGIDLGAILDDVQSALAKRRLLRKVKFGLWEVCLYFGPSVDREEVQELVYTVVGKTQFSSEARIPEVREDIDHTLVEFGDTTFASWTSTNKDDLIKAVELAYNNEFSFYTEESING